MLLTLPEALKLLLPFKHASRTDLGRKVLTNRDAAAVLFASCGPLMFRQVAEVLNEWRTGAKPEYVEREVMYTDWRAKRDPQTGRHPSRKARRRFTKGMAFTYLFNTSRYGNYGSVGADFLTQGNVMHRGGGGKASGDYYGGSGGTSQVIRAPAKIVRGETFFRRTYWYRISHGTYAPTLEGFRRLAELGLTVSNG